MKTQSLIGIPLAFLAGMVGLVLLQFVGVVKLSSPVGGSDQTSQFDSSSSGIGASGDASIELSKTADESAAASGLAGTDTANHEQVAALTLQLTELRKQVQAATVERDVMQRQIEELGDFVESESSNNAFLPSGQSAGTGEATPNEFNANQANEFNRRRGFGQPDGDEQYNSLVAAGIDPSVAAEIKQRSDQWSLQRLELIDQATREGWRRSDQFEERIDELREERPDIRSELGDTDYDQYLYVSGEPNRVQIASIIDGSAAQLAGIETGDLLRTYANERVFSSREVQRATREGARGEMVPVTVERDGQLLNLELPRGPLGVTLNGQRVEPNGF